MRQRTVRCFPTKCRRCEADVLYWEGERGSKTFFGLPIYGKPIRHICPVKKKNKNGVKTTFEELRLKEASKKSYSCPVCKKIMSSEMALSNHYKKLAKQDDIHADFLDFFELDESSNIQSETKEDDTTSVNRYSFVIKKKQKKDFDRFLK